MSINQIQKKYTPLSRTLLFYLSVLLIPLVFGVAITDFFLTRNDAIAFNKKLEIQTEKTIIYSLDLINSLYSLLEINLYNSIESIISETDTYFLKNKDIPELIQLQKLALLPVEITFFSREGNVLKSTSQENKTSNDTKKYVTHAITNNPYIHKKINYQSGSLTLFYYQLLENTSYVMEIIVSSDNEKKMYESFSIQKTISKLGLLNSAIESIRLFDRQGLNHDFFGTSINDPIELDDISSLWNTETVIEKQNYQTGRIIRYFYIPGSDEETDRIIEIIYSTKPLIHILSSKAFRSCIMIVLSFILAVLFSLFIAYRVSKPIPRIISMLNSLASGNLDTPISVSSKNEIYLIEEGILRMSTSLKEKILQIEKADSEIKKYSENLEDIVATRTRDLEESNSMLVFAFDKTRTELITARAVQNAIMPPTPAQNGNFTFSAAFIPMEELGGDFFDFIPISPTKTAVVLADVIGHGISAALVTMMAKISFASNVHQYKDAATIMTNVNIQISRSLGDVEKYFTAFFALIDTQAMTCEFVNAGHPEAYLVKKDGTALKLKATSPLIGAFEEAEIESQTLLVSHGDKLVIYTDGISETRTPQGVFYGQERLLNLINENTNDTNEELCQKIIVDVLTYREEGPVEDDTTIIVAGIL